MERKDTKGRILRKGEYQRKNSYAYRHVDEMSGDELWVYAKTLADLRKKEKSIREGSASSRRSARKITLDEAFDD